MARVDLIVLEAFLAVAEEQSFTRAAKRLGVSTSAVSHAIRRLEDRLGVRLLARTTRSVATTDAGQQLIGRLRPALVDIEESLDDISRQRDRPAGRLRLVMPRAALTLVVAARLGQFAREYADVVLDISTDDSPLDFDTGRFDAGIHLKEFIKPDMVAVRVSGEMCGAIVGSPRYFALRGKPGSPHDLSDHRCINIRMGSAGVYRCEFDKGNESLVLGVDGALIIDDLDTSIRAAIDDVGLAFSFVDHVKPYVESGALVSVLEDWCAPFPGFFLYYPSRK